MLRVRGLMVGSEGGSSRHTIGAMTCVSRADVMSLLTTIIVSGEQSVSLVRVSGARLLTVAVEASRTGRKCTLVVCLTVLCRVRFLWCSRPAKLISRTESPTLMLTSVMKLTTVMQDSAQFDYYSVIRLLSTLKGTMLVMTSIEWNELNLSIRTVRTLKIVIRIVALRFERSCVVVRVLLLKVIWQLGGRLSVVRCLWILVAIRSAMHLLVMQVAMAISCLWLKCLTWPGLDMRWGLVTRVSGMDVLAAWSVKCRLLSAVRFGSLLTGSCSIIGKVLLLVLWKAVVGSFVTVSCAAWLTLVDVMLSSFVCLRLMLRLRLTCGRCIGPSMLCVFGALDMTWLILVVRCLSLVSL